MYRFRTPFAAVLVASCLTIFAGCSSSGSSASSPPPKPSPTTQAATTVPAAPTTTEFLTSAAVANSWTATEMTAFINGCSGKGVATPAVCGCIAHVMSEQFTPAEVVKATADSSSADAATIVKITTGCATKMSSTN